MNPRHPHDPRPRSAAWRCRLWLVALLGGSCVEGWTAGDPFAGQAVWPIEFRLTPDDMDRLRRDSRGYVPATILVGGEAIAGARVKLKGRGSYQPLDDKPSFTVSLKETGSALAGSGLTKFHLNNSAQDPSYLRERTATALFIEAGVPAPRVAHARVRVNDRALGLYLLKEGFTRDFVRRHFPPGEGDLYDDDLGHDVDQRLDRDLAGAKPDDQAGLKRLAQAAQEPDLDRRWIRLQETLDVPAFLRFMAMELMTGHWDGYCLGQNNFRVYHDPVRDRVVFLPAGMDQVFAKADLPWKAAMSGLVARAILETPQGSARYEAVFRDLFGRLFDSERIRQRLDRMLAELRPELSPAEFRPLREAGEALAAQITGREDSLARQLSMAPVAVAVFDGRIASLAGWEAVAVPAVGAMRALRGEASAGILQIVADDRTAASWRTRVRLPPGRYRFRGRARAMDVAPLPFGEHQGACLRVAGRDDCSASLVGTTGWESLEVGFVVAPGEDEIELICQLRASGGEAQFDRNSLGLAREP